MLAFFIKSKRVWVKQHSAKGHPVRAHWKEDPRNKAVKGKSYKDMSIPELEKTVTKLMDIRGPVMAVNEKQPESYKRAHKELSSAFDALQSKREKNIRESQERTPSIKGNIDKVIKKYGYEIFKNRSGSSRYIYFTPLEGNGKPILFESSTYVPRVSDLSVEEWEEDLKDKIRDTLKYNPQYADKFKEFPDLVPDYKEQKI